MKYLLNTNICIQYLNNRSDKTVERFFQTGRNKIAICSVVKAELYFGAQKSNLPEKTLEKLERFISFFYSYAFDDIAAKEYGVIRTNLERSGNIIGPNDLMIASIAKANDLILVTNNTKEFFRVAGLLVEDWSL